MACEFIFTIWRDFWICHPHNFQFLCFLSPIFFSSLFSFLFSFMFIFVLSGFVWCRLEVGGGLNFGGREEGGVREERHYESLKVDVFVNGLCWRGGVSDVHRNSINLNWNTTVAFVRPSVCVYAFASLNPAHSRGIGRTTERERERERDGYEKVRFYKCVHLVSGSESKSEWENKVSPLFIKK